MLDVERWREAIVMSRPLLQAPQCCGGTHSASRHDDAARRWEAQCVSRAPRRPSLAKWALIRGTALGQLGGVVVGGDGKVGVSQHALSGHGACEARLDATKAMRAWRALGQVGAANEGRSSGRGMLRSHRRIITGDQLGAAGNGAAGNGWLQFQRVGWGGVGCCWVRVR